jgi:hypothetical protein
MKKIKLGSLVTVNVMGLKDRLGLVIDNNDNEYRRLCRVYIFSLKDWYNLHWDYLEIVPRENA